jgi:hypothetical protein
MTAADFKKEVSDPMSFGLLGMREPDASRRRATLDQRLGGKGTKLAVRVPIRYGRTKGRHGFSCRHGLAPVFSVPSADVKNPHWERPSALQARPQGPGEKGYLVGVAQIDLRYER